MMVASSILSFLTSHRGDSGRMGVIERRMKMKMSCKAMGKRQVTGPEAWNMPKFTHEASARPLRANTPSIETRRPRFSLLAVSLTYMGTVPV